LETSRLDDETVALLCECGDNDALTRVELVASAAATRSTPRSLRLVTGLGAVIAGVTTGSRLRAEPSRNRRAVRRTETQAFAERVLQRRV
jgi:hypothetical protein